MQEVTFNDANRSEIVGFGTRAQYLYRIARQWSKEHREKRIYWVERADANRVSVFVNLDDMKRLKREAIFNDTDDSPFIAITPAMRTVSAVLAVLHEEIVANMIGGNIMYVEDYNRQEPDENW